MKKVAKKTADIVVTPSALNAATVDETALFATVAGIIETRKSRAGAYANREVTLMYWEIGRYINTVLLGGERAEYGKRIVATLSRQLVGRYGTSFSFDNIRRMMRFAEVFEDVEIVAPLAPQLSWSHFIELLPLSSHEARMYYANDAATRHWGKLELRRQISRKAYERQEIANAALTSTSSIPFNMFKDPFLLDTLGLKDNYLEADLEKAILSGLEAFILEFGHGFTLSFSSGIAVAEYWTSLPPKATLEAKVQSILCEARERLHRRTSLPSGENQRHIDYFYEKDEALS